MNKLPTIRGKCGICNQIVTTNDLRYKTKFKKYYHQKCMNLNQNEDDVPILDDICCVCHKPISKLDEKIYFNNRFYHKDHKQCVSKKNISNKYI